MRKIPLTRGKAALVDDADYDWLNQSKWYASRGNYRHIFYAQHDSGPRNNRKRNRMHRVILGLQPGDGLQCDHRDGNGLNNQRSNLRICTVTENNQSRRKLKMLTSKYRGVWWHRGARKWQSQIKVNKKKIYLGLYNSEIESAKAYDVAALKYHKQFALTNERLGLL